MTRYALDAAGLTDRGIKRDHNEDAWSGPPTDLSTEQKESKGLLYLVADGVGGHQAGDVASALAADIIQQRYYADSSPDVATSLTAAIQAAHQAISREAADKSEQYGMGTTVTAVVLRGNELTIANVGDSRAYLVREGQAYQLTTDHTWVEEQVRLGLITRQEASRHPQRNIITRSLGGEQIPQVDIFEEQVEPGESLLLCSDGLSNMLTDVEIASRIHQGKNAKSITHALIELAKERGAPDNVTAVLLRLRQTGGGLGRLLLIAAIFGGLVFLIGGLALALLDGRESQAVPLSPEPTLEPLPPTITPHPSQPPTASPLPSPLNTPTVTLLPLDATLARPELTWPEPNASFAGDDLLLFSWKWNQELEGEGWHFVFEIQSQGGVRPLLREELPFNQRGYDLAQPLAPGEYWWAVSVVSSNRRGEAAQRQLVIIEPVPSASPTNP